MPHERGNQFALDLPTTPHGIAPGKFRVNKEQGGQEVQRAAAGTTGAPAASEINPDEFKVLVSKYHQLVSGELGRVEDAFARANNALLHHDLRAMQLVVALRSSDFSGASRLFEEIRSLTNQIGEQRDAIRQDLPSDDLLGTYREHMSENGAEFMTESGRLAAIDKMIMLAHVHNEAVDELAKDLVASDKEALQLIQPNHRTPLSRVLRAATNAIQPTQYDAGKRKTESMFLGKVLDRSLEQTMNNVVRLTRGKDGMIEECEALVGKLSENLKNAKGKSNFSDDLIAECKQEVSRKFSLLETSQQTALGFAEAQFRQMMETTAGTVGYDEKVRLAGRYLCEFIDLNRDLERGKSKIFSEIDKLQAEIDLTPEI